MSKQVGAPCPSCNAHPCAEHQQMDQPMRWNCSHCGASGDLAGQKPIAKASSAPQQKPHWTNKRG